MSTINDSDLLLVERNGNLHQITYDQMSTLNDDDILLVERGGVQYKVEAQYVSTGPNGVILPSVEVLTPLNGAGLNDGQSYTPMSSAYVSTDTSDVYFRHSYLVETISGGTWDDLNLAFNGHYGSDAVLSGVVGEVSQATIYMDSAIITEGNGFVYGWATNGGTAEVLDENEAVLRTYALPTATSTFVELGIIRPEYKIRLTTAQQNEELKLSAVLVDSYIEDYVIPGRVTFEFTDDTDLDKMVAPIIQTDANGDVKVPTTSTVDSTTTIPGLDKFTETDYTGNGSTRTFNQASGSKAPPVGDRMVWGKVDGTGTGFISDNVALFQKYLLTAENAAQQTYIPPSLYDTYSEYPTGNAYVNVSGSQNYIAEIGVAPKILDIVTWDGNDASVREIPHNLGTMPGMIIVKRTSSSANWMVWHKDLTPNHHLYLNLNNSQNNDSTAFPSQPTKDNFYVGGQSQVNGGDQTFVAYVFAAETAGKVKCGYYYGSSGNTFVTTGFKTGFFLTKCATQAYDWTATTLEASLQQKRWNPNTASSLGGNSSYNIDLNNNTLVYFNGSSISYNTINEKYVYLAIAHDLTGPQSTQLNLLSGQDLEYFTAGTQITSNAAASGSNISFSSNTYTGNGSLTFRTPNVSSNTNWFDITSATGNKWLVWIKSYSASGLDHVLHDSDRNYYERLETNNTIPNTYDDNKYILPHKDSSNSGYKVTPAGEDHNESNVNFISWNFLGAPQFFDVQKYVGTGSGSGSGTTKVISHDLGVEPGCIIVKGLSNQYNWAVYHSELAEGQCLFLNSNSTPSLSIGSFFVGADENTFTVGDSAMISQANKDYISYIFAKDTPYVKCGKYVGSGNGTSVNVGFKPRWVMIKNITEALDWMILDKNIPSNKTLSPNTTSQSVALANGYQFTSDGFSFGGSDTETNHSSYEYVYVAIADESEGHPPAHPSTSTVTETPDPNIATMVVNAESFDTGATASAPALEASITSVAGSDGNTLLVDGSTGTWVPGLYAKGSETTINAPGPDEITFTSQNQGTPAFSGVDATLASRTWTLESGTTATGPWTLVDTYVDYDVLNSQTGATPWSSNKPNLTPNTFYRVKVQYNSTNAESVESVYNTFKTGDA